MKTITLCILASYSAIGTFFCGVAATNLPSCRTLPRAAQPPAVVAPVVFPDIIADLDNAVSIGPDAIDDLAALVDKEVEMFAGKYAKCGR